MKMFHIIISLLGTVLIIGCVPITENSTVVNIEEHRNRILIPIKINNKIYTFLWDTGCDKSLISKHLLSECNIGKSGDSTRVLAFARKGVSGHCLTELTSFSIGDIDMNAVFVVDNSTRLVIDYDQFAIDGVMGQDIIDQHSWSFDFRAQTVNISDRPTKVESPANFTLDFNINPALRLPYCPVVFNDTLAELALFDSGMAGKVLAKNEKEEFVYADLLVTSQDTLTSLWFDIAACHDRYRMLTDTRDQVAIIQGGVMESLKINEFTPAATLIALDVDKNHQSTPLIYITANFMRRFSEMYYDPFNKKIYFYKSDSDTGLYTGLEIEEFFRL